MKFTFKNTRSIVISGYCLLVALAITGIAAIYFEVIKSHRQSQEHSVPRKELIELSNTLTTMYQTEGTAGLLTLADNEKSKIEYDSLTNRVFDQIDSLRSVSSDPNINLSLDSLSALLLKQRDNALEISQLMKQIDKTVVREITKKNVISQSDIDKLNVLLADAIQTKMVKANTDTLTGSASETKEPEIPLLRSTIVDFIRKINKNTQLKNAENIRQLFVRQQELYSIKEVTALQINTILGAMKEREYQTNLELLKEKNESLRLSFSLIAVIGLLALIVAVFFMSWTLLSVNKAQRLQKNIQEAKKQAEKLLLSREQLIYTITHDIKTPLSSIIGFLDLLMSEVALSQKQQYYVNNMYSSVSHIQDLARNLLDFHSIKKEQPHLNSIVFSPNSLLHSIYESFLPLAQKKKLVFEIKSVFPETKSFLSDPYYIRQIVNNLLSNAIKFTPEKGRVFLTASLEEQNLWKISVQDTGPGIDPADQTKIFEEFVRLGNQKKEVEGTGLGLTISEKLAALLGGIIEVESQKGIGSTFTLTVPLISIAEKAIPQPRKVSDIVSGRILFLDDDQAQLNLLSELMKREGWPCICCSNAYEALDLLRKTSFDIIFTDIYIPGMEGLELVQRIRKSNFPRAATIPIIAFSADCRKSEAELKAAGFTGYLLKPFKVQQLLEIVEKYTPLKRKSDEIRPEKGEFGWRRMMDFVIDDKEAAMKIVDSFIEETTKEKEILRIAFQRQDNMAIKRISHKMLTLMRMISAHEIVSILTDFEKGIVSKEKKDTLFRLLDETLMEAEATRQIAIEPEIVIN